VSQDDMIMVLQESKLRWYRYVLRKDKNDWVKKCMDNKVEGVRRKGRPKKTWRKVVKKDYQSQRLNRADAVDYRTWRKLIKDVV